MSERAPRLLAIDTSGEACSAALLAEGVIHQRCEIAPRRHGELILGMMDAVLKEAGLELPQLDALAFGRGPGSFTGVRIATAVIQGAAFGAARPVVGISTLAALAQGALRRAGVRQVLSALDARMNEVYWGCFTADEADLMQPCCEERVCPPQEAAIPPGESGAWHGVGPGWSAYVETLTDRLGAQLSSLEPEALCEAQDIATLAAAAFTRGEAVAAEFALPVYLRDQVTR